MALIPLDLNPDRKTLRQFGLIAFFAFGALAAWIGWRGSIFGVGISFGWASLVAGLFLGLSVLCLGLALVAPKAVRPIYVGLTLVTFPIGFVVSHVILAVLYFFILTPVGVLLRASGKDPMQRAYDPEATSYWEKKTPVSDVRRYFRQY